MDDEYAGNQYGHVRHALDSLRISAWWQVTSIRAFEGIEFARGWASKQKQTWEV
jgi:hypothetical protein